MDIDRKQRTDIDKVQDDRISLAIDELTLQQSSYSYPLTNFSGTNWLNENGTFVKYNIVEEDNIKFIVEPITQLAQKDILNIKLSLDYEIDEGNIIINNVFLIHNDLMDYKIVKNEIKGIGHIDIECQIFDINPKLLNTVITEQGFDIGIGINGNKSNSTVKFSNVRLVFEFDNKLSDETDAVVNRLIPEIDFWREGNKLYLQVGDVSESHGSHGGGGTDIDTYTKDEIDNLLNRKVNAEIGKTLSSNDYTSIEKRKLEGIEENANYYAHPSIHETNMIIESSPLSSVGTGEEATQHEINLNINNSLGNKANSEDIPLSISDLVNDSDFIEKSNTPGLVKNDGSIDSTTYLSSLPLHNHDDRYYTESEVDTALNNKQATLVSGTNIKTINNTSLLGSGNITISGGGSSVEIVTDWGNQLSDSKVPSEKLTKESLDEKTDVGHTHEDTEINSSYTDIEMSTIRLATLNDVLAYNEPFLRINRALEHMLDNWDNYD